MHMKTKLFLFCAVIAFSMFFLYACAKGYEKVDTAPEISIESSEAVLTLDLRKYDVNTTTTATTSKSLAITSITTRATNDVERSSETSTLTNAKDLIKNGIFYCYYTVKYNDEWNSLCTRYKVTKEQICAFNGINPNECLQEGWNIYIPLDTYVPPSTWVYDYYSDYETVNDNSKNEDNIFNEDGLVWSNSVQLYTTNSEVGSWHNIKLSADMLNGFRLGPGETFSWFNDMGPCQYEDGFVDGGAYVEGGSAPGGGICFTSTALMQGARGAGCIITEKYDHTNPVSYASPGDEAAVSWGSLDLKFYNPSKTTGLEFWVTADSLSQSITVTVNTYYQYE